MDLSRLSQKKKKRDLNRYKRWHSYAILQYATYILLLTKDLHINPNIFMLFNHQL